MPRPRPPARMGLRRVGLPDFPLSLFQPVLGKQLVTVSPRPHPGFRAGHKNQVGKGWKEIVLTSGKAVGEGRPGLRGCQMDLLRAPGTRRDPGQSPLPEFMRQCRGGLRDLSPLPAGRGPHVHVLTRARLTSACPHCCPRRDPQTREYMTSQGGRDFAGRMNQGA